MHNCGITCVIVGNSYGGVIQQGCELARGYSCILLLPLPLPLHTATATTYRYLLHDYGTRPDFRPDVREYGANRSTRKQTRLVAGCICNQSTIGHRDANTFCIYHLGNSCTLYMQ